MINEQEVVVRTCKKVEYTPLKLYENKRIAWRSHQRNHQKVQRDYFWCRYPHLHGMPRWALKAASHRLKSVWSKVGGWYVQETCFGWTSKKYGEGWWHDDRQEDRWGVGPWRWFNKWEKPILRVDFIVFVDRKVTCHKVEGLHVLNGTDTLDTWSICVKNLLCLLSYLVQVILLAVLSWSVLPWPGLGF